MFSNPNFSRRSANRNNVNKSKPPSGPTDRHSFTSGVANRKPSSESSNPNREPTPDTDQKTLLDIDRDITRFYLYFQMIFPVEKDFGTFKRNCSDCGKVFFFLDLKCLVKGLSSQRMIQWTK